MPLEADREERIIKKGCRVRARTTLDALNFALAGAREGFGPFLGVYLQATGFDPAATGIAMAIAGASGLVATTPLGALIDHTERKRLAMVLAVAAIAVGAVVIVLARSVWIIGAAQALIGVGDTTIAPLVSALTLGVVGQALFCTRMARNEAFNHAGNAANAAFAAVLGYYLGLGTVAIAIVMMALVSSLAVSWLKLADIDHVAARSGERDERSTVRALLANHGLLLLAFTVMMFQTANGAMLPFLAQARTAAGGDPSITTGVMVVVARVAMVGAAMGAPWLAAWRGYAGMMTLSLLAVVMRGALAYYAATWAVILPVQLLEGVSMGLASVAIPALSAEVMSGTGRAGAGLGAVLTTFGLGATFSPLVAGFAAQRTGFPASFLVLGLIAGAGLVVWTLARRLVGTIGFAATTAPAADAG